MVDAKLARVIKLALHCEDYCQTAAIPHIIVLVLHGDVHVHAGSIKHIFQRDIQSRST